jgi:hypothetical protein
MPDWIKLDIVDYLFAIAVAFVMWVVLCIVQNLFQRFIDWRWHRKQDRIIRDRIF